MKKGYLQNKLVLLVKQGKYKYETAIRYNLKWNVVWIVINCQLNNHLNCLHLMLLTIVREPHSYVLFWRMTPEILSLVDAFDTV